MVSHPLDKGSFGTVYECIDLNMPNQLFVIKVSDNYQMLGREIEALKSIKNSELARGIVYPYEYVPVVISKGMFILETPDGDQQEGIR
jgi:serine/threonine protein kinase